MSGRLARFRREFAACGPLAYLDVAGLAAATQKGLPGMYGLGVLYCCAEWIERLRPPFLSRQGADNQTAHKSSLGDPDAYRLHGDARRFELGNHNLAGILALDAALTLLHEPGVLELSGELADGLACAGYRLATLRPAANRAGFVAFEHPAAEPPAQPPSGGDRGAAGELALP